MGTGTYRAEFIDIEIHRNILKPAGTSMIRCRRYAYQEYSKSGQSCYGTFHIKIIKYVDNIDDGTSFILNVFDIFLKMLGSRYRTVPDSCYRYGTNGTLQVKGDF